MLWPVFLLPWYIFKTKLEYFYFCWTCADYFSFLQHGRNEVNVELKKEAEFFGDIVIVPFMDSYDLVVLKTIAICEYGVCLRAFFLQNLLL
jgi:hypothetical protein